MERDGNDKPHWWRESSFELATEEKVVLLRAVAALNNLAETEEDCELSSDALEILLQNDLECGEIFARWCSEGHLGGDGDESAEALEPLGVKDESFKSASETNAGARRNMVGMIILCVVASCPVVEASRTNARGIATPPGVDATVFPVQISRVVGCLASLESKNEPIAEKAIHEIGDGGAGGNNAGVDFPVRMSTIGDILVAPPEIIELPSGDPEIVKTFDPATKTTTREIRGRRPKKEKLTPICHVTPDMIKRLDELIREKSDDLFDRWIPPINFNVGTRFNTGVMDRDYLRDTMTGPGQKRDYPSVGVSLSIPLYDPDAAASREQGQARFLDRNLGFLRDLEYRQKRLDSLIENRKLIRKRLDLEGLDHVKDLYENERLILDNISRINMVIRYFEQAFDVDMKGLREREE